MAMTAEQCMAGRILAQIGRDGLAAMAGVPIEHVTSFEAKETVAKPTVAGKLERALAALGVELIRENGGGAGVRLKFTGGETVRLSTWEDKAEPLPKTRCLRKIAADCSGTFDAHPSEHRFIMFILLQRGGGRK